MTACRRGTRNGAGSRAAGAAVLAAACALAAPGAAAGQGVRGALLTTARYVEIRPIALDSVPIGQVERGEDGRDRFDGFPVTCLGGSFCTFYRPAEVVSAVALTQDLGFTAWGLGMHGLSATVQMRGRTEPTGEFAWPRSDDPFDMLLAYAELSRERYRIRMGRQRTLSGLGFASFDGVDVLTRPAGWLRVEGFGGRSLARGLEEPRHRALEGIETFLPDPDALIVGGGLEVEAGASGAALRYQREIWRDRSALVSERASLDLSSRRLRPLSLQASVDYDFAFGRVGRAHATLRLPIERARLMLEVTGRRYLPYFELWTIWGYFNPVAYHEAALHVGWTPSERAGLWILGAWRRYDDTNTTLVFGRLQDESTRLDARGRVRFSDAFSMDGAYRLDTGFGAFLSSGDLAFGWEPAEWLRLSVHGTAFQQILEFRVGEGAVLGGGGTADLLLGRRLRLSGGLDIYRQAFENRPTALDWNQARGWAALRIGFGEDPGPGERGTR